MKVLFVASGNSKNDDMVPFIKNQGASLSNAGIEMSYFPITDKGLSGYLKSALKLREYLKHNAVDLIHAHYTLSGWAAVLAFPKQPIVLSLMGTDAYGEYIAVNRVRFSSRYLTWLTKLIQPFVQALISKSSHIAGFVYLKKKSYVVPNGILLKNIIDHKNQFHGELGLNPAHKNILFLGNRSEKRKNYKTVEEAIKRIDSKQVSLIAPYPVPHDKVIKYLHSVDVLVAPSLMEGSPNVVKEAMACNCPVVATDVGDVSWLFGNEPGHFLCGFDPEDVAEKIQAALAFSETVGRTNGRKRIETLGLDSRQVADKIITIYQKEINCAR